ncbi:MAG: transketolase, partial [Candidatus Dormibacteraceae bacterium]
EDHHPEGGLGSAVMEALALEPQPPRVIQCAVRLLPGSGTGPELMDYVGISGRQIAQAARELLKG